MIKKRADILLVEKGLVKSRERAKKIILEGSVFIGEEEVLKASQMVKEDSDIDIRVNPLTFVSRAGLKLEKAIDEFAIKLNNIVAIDIGSSTGGFTECMLKEGARKVYAIDVGKDQLVEELRNDSRVVVMEETNIKNVRIEDFVENIDFITIDVSFISLKLVLPIANKLLKSNGEIVALIKPQFEVGKDNIGKKGIVKDRKLHLKVLESITEFSADLDFEVKGLTFSPITGSKGNIEFLMHLKKNNIKKPISRDSLLEIINKAEKFLD